LHVIAPNTARAYTLAQPAPYSYTSAMKNSTSQILKPLLESDETIMPDRRSLPLVSLWLPVKGKFGPHFWIRLATGETVDFRSRMWFEGDVRIPQGIFREDGKAVSYAGREIDLPVTKAVFAILTGRASLPKA
jgi:hypothetical protein